MVGLSQAAYLENFLAQLPAMEACQGSAHERSVYAGPRGC